MSHAWTHSWCRSPARDEAVRAAEDGRSGPLPTLEDVIAEPFAHSPGTCETGEGQSGLRTERVTERRPVQLGGGENVTPAASGWLTAEERSAIQWAISEGFDEEVLRNLLARSSPPEVVHPECFFDEFSGCSAVHAWNICAADFRKALAAAGVTVKEVGRE